MVVTNDVHYVLESDGSPHDVLLCVQTSARGQRAKSHAHVRQLLPQEPPANGGSVPPYLDLPASAFDNTLRIAEMCGVDLEDNEYHLPDLPIPEGNYKPPRHHRAGSQAACTASRPIDAIQERKERELRIIHEMGFDVCF